MQRILDISFTLSFNVGNDKYIDATSELTQLMLFSRHCFGILEEAPLP
jgi:hypothetical protein